MFHSVNTALTVIKQKLCINGIDISSISFLDFKELSDLHYNSSSPSYLIYFNLAVHQLK